MFNTQILAGSSGQGGGITQQSLKFNDDESQYLSWTPASAGNRKTWTWSGWVKRGNLGVTVSLMDVVQTSGTDWTRFHFNSSNQLAFAVEISNSNVFQFVTTQVFRDPSAWYHIVAAYDSTQATSTNRFKLYVNGEQITAFDTETYGAQNTDSHFSAVLEHNIGAVNTGIWFFDGYMSDIHFIDGQALDASSFGETVDGYWKAKDFAGTYGQNGFRLTFKDDVVSEGFNTVTYRGTGASQSISGLGFSPDLVWTKAREGTSSHNLSDSIRGGGVGLTSNGTNAEYALSPANTFDSDGFTLNKTTSQFNSSGDTFVGWCWDAGSGSAASNTDGSITSTVKANTDYGFSIVKWVGDGTSQGATVGHSLGVTPSMIIVKSTDSTAGWNVWHEDLTNATTSRLVLNDDSDEFDSVYVWGSTAPDNSAFGVGTVGTTTWTNRSSRNYIAYCFAEVANYSSIGSYTGNGSTSGPTVTTGFRPSFVMFKRTDNTGNWFIVDTTRNPFNPLDLRLYPNLSNADSAADSINVTDTGFEIVASFSDINASSGTYIYMAFADTREAAFWKDVSGQGNNWTPNNLDYRDSLPDSPANNFAVMNSIDVPSTGTLSEGNLKIAGANYLRRKANWHFGAGGIQSGKWYWEICNIGSSYGTDNGVIGSLTEAGGENFLVANKSYFRTGGIYKNYTATSYVSSGASYTSGDVVGFALDLDSSPQTIKYYHNGTLVNTDTTISAAPVLVPFTSSTNGSWPDTYYNFGQDSTFSGAKPMGAYTDDSELGNFQHQPPAGFKSLCTANLPDPTIVDGSEHFNTVLYTGTGSTRGVTGVGFGSAPDFVWTKQRSGSARAHRLNDIVRGANKQLYSNLTNAEGTATDELTSFDSDGFSLGPDNGVNNSGDTYVAWNWKAGGTAVSNTDGSITSSVSANTTAGFSIVSYTGTGANATVGHGLSTAPSFVIVKGRNETRQWIIGSDALTDWTKYLLFTTASEGTASDVWNSTAPTSSVFSVGTNINSNKLNVDYIAYCFANTDGYLKAGSYTGNGSSDGTFVYTGFRPAWIMIKRTDSTADWYLYDAKRNAYNLVNGILQPNESDVEAASSNNSMDFTSNGFKLRGSGATINGSGGTFIYLAFAESPFKYATAR